MNVDGGKEKGPGACLITYSIFGVGTEKVAVQTKKKKYSNTLRYKHNPFQAVILGTRISNLFFFP